MEKLIAQLLRLYWMPGVVTPQRLTQHLLGQAVPPLTLAAPDGLTRAIVVPVENTRDDGEDGHWTRLCALARALQVEHGFPAPAVSVDGVHGYRLWISLEAPVALAQARRFVAGLYARHAPGVALRPGALDEAPLLPPCPVGGDKWAAFIHPGMGASFADEPALDFAPPPAAQAAFLEGLESVGPAAFAQALAALEPAADSSPRESAPAAQDEDGTASASTPAGGAAPTRAEGLLLRDATLEDIVRHLHARNIEPTFRHLLPRAADSGR